MCNVLPVTVADSQASSQCDPTPEDAPCAPSRIETSMQTLPVTVHAYEERRTYAEGQNNEPPIGDSDDPSLFIPTEGPGPKELSELKSLPNSDGTPPVNEGNATRPTATDQPPPLAVESSQSTLVDGLEDIKCVSSFIVPSSHSWLNTHHSCRRLKLTCQMGPRP